MDAARLRAGGGREDPEPGNTRPGLVLYAEGRRRGGVRSVNYLLRSLIQLIHPVILHHQVQKSMLFKEINKPMHKDSKHADI